MQDRYIQARRQNTFFTTTLLLHVDAITVNAAAFISGFYYILSIKYCSARHATRHVSHLFR